jgi:hypothetical protein
MYMFPRFGICTKKNMSTLLLALLVFRMKTVKSPGGVAQWTSHPPQEQNPRVRIPPGHMLGFQVKT